MEAARQACAFAALIVIDDATAVDPCEDSLVAVVTRRQLARSGSTEVFFDRQSAARPPEIRFAVEQKYRPWHTQRKFSREARGLPPREKARRAKKERSGASTTGVRPRQ
jgi:competence protein ComEC